MAFELTRKTMGYPDLSDQEAAAMVRMLYRDTLNHESICCMARDRILVLSAENEEKDKTIEQLKSKVEKAVQVGEIGRGSVKNRKKENRT